MTLHIAVCTHVGLGSLARLTLPLHQRRVAYVPYPSLRDLQFLYGELRLHFLPHSEEEKPPSMPKSQCNVCGQTLIKWEVFPFSSFLFLYFSPILSSLSLILTPSKSHLALQIFFLLLWCPVSLPSQKKGCLTGGGWSPAPPWSQSWYWAVRGINMNVIMYVGVNQKQQVTGCRKSTCSSTCSLQSLPSSFALCSLQEAAAAASSQRHPPHTVLFKCQES